MVKKLKEYKKFLKVVTNIKVDNKYDIPYFAGYNWGGTKVYIDRDVPKFVVIIDKKINLHLSLAMHEYVEKHFINQGYTYAGAHEIATQYERAYIESHGITWKDYDHQVGKLMHANWVSKLKSIPKDLDMTPYEYCRDVKTLAKIRKFFVK